MTDTYNLPDNKQQYKYWAYGLNILSQIEFPELQHAKFDQPDVRLNIGTVEDTPGEVRRLPAGILFVLNDTQFVFEINNVGRYLAQNGDTIIVQPNDNLESTRLLRLFILSTVFVAILMQRRQLPMHASAILHHNQLVLICGDSGAGKSTSLAGLIKKGYTVFSDDVVVLDKAVNATASYPMIKLWEDAQDKLEHDTFDDRSFVIKPGMNKYGIFFHDEFDTGGYPVKKVLILKKGDVPHITSTEVTASAAFQELSKQVYRPMLIHNNELRALKFSIISKLANTSKVYQITRPTVCDVNHLVSCIENLVYNEA